MRLGIFVPCFALSTLLAFAGVEASTINDLSWLAGCWGSNHDDRSTSEHWLKPAGGTMLGVGRTVAEGKTVEFEFMQIKEMPSGEIHFVAKPSGQPEATFKLIKSGPREAVFENPEHDYPQRVIYRLQEDGSLLGRIEGKEKGKERAVDFPMKRERCD